MRAATAVSPDVDAEKFGEDQQIFNRLPWARRRVEFSENLWTRSQVGGKLDRAACIDPCRAGGEHGRGQLDVGRARQWRSREDPPAIRWPWPGADHGLIPSGLNPLVQSWGGCGRLELGSSGSRNSRISPSVYVERDREDGGTDDWSQREEDIGEESQRKVNLNRSFF